VTHAARPIAPTASPPVDTDRNRRLLVEIETGDAALVVVTGPALAGRSTLLDQLAAALADRGEHTVMLRIAPHPVAPPHVVRSLDRPPAGTTILVDDAHRLDPPSLAALERLVRQSAGTRVVCTAHLPVRRIAPVAVFDRLRQDGLARQVRLRPLGRRDVAALTAAAVSARPDPNLVAHLHDVTGGVPGALAGVVGRYLRNDSIRLVDGWAHLAPRRPLPGPSEHDDLLLDVRQLGTPAWSVAKALAVFFPLGGAAPALASAALGAGTDTVSRCLAQLHETGVLRRTAGGGWRFRVPLVAAALSAHLGPFERRDLARHAITALWRGDVRCADPNYLPEQLAVAGRLVDPARARAQLLAAAADAGNLADQWLHAAAALAPDRPGRARTVLAQARTALTHGDHEQAMRCAATVRAELAGHLSTGDADELAMVQVLASHAAGDTAAVARLSGRGSAVARATALFLLDRWGEGATLLDAARTGWENSPSAHAGHLLEAHAHLVAGRPDLARKDVDTAFGLLPTDASRTQAAGFEALAEVVATGAHGALAGLTRRSVPVAALPLPVRAVLAARDGRLDHAMALFRHTVVAGTARGTALSHTFLYETVATINLARGRLSRGREVLAAARLTNPPLPYLLSCAEALIDQALGEPDQAREALRHGLEHAATHGTVLDTDRLWRGLAEVELSRHDRPSAQRCLPRLDRAAAALGTAGAALNQALAHAVVERDRRAAATALQLARERDDPFEHATVIASLVEHGAADPVLLTTSYRLLDDLDVPLRRAWLRTAMRDNGIPIPGRGRTQAENERLLSVLVADGLSNRQIATVLRTSERSVEGRLGRLFSRTGYQSRVEVAVAMLTSG
jgi:DNA-binding CsgD family transcriptional regulator/tetratricopeptide (TPR) repeat protein